jgi:hypothetical protein
MRHTRFPFLQSMHGVLLGTLVSALMSSSPVEAQLGPSAKQTSVVFELGTFVPAHTTRKFVEAGQINLAFAPHLSWTAGVMRQLTGGRSLGMTGEAGASTLSYRLALEPRYRVSVGRGITADVAAGALWTRVGNVRESGGTGVTGDVRLNFPGNVGLVARVDRLRTSDYGTGSAVYGGIVVRDKPAVVTTGVLGSAAALVLLFAALFGPFPNNN